MKKITFYLVSLCAAGIPAFAQFSNFTGYVGGGFTTPVNPIGSRVDTGWNITAGAGYNVNHHFGMMLDFIYTRTESIAGFSIRFRRPTETQRSGASRWIPSSMSPRKGRWIST
jgi:hypothetical protein